MLTYRFTLFIFVYAVAFTCLYLRCKDRLPFTKYLSNHFLFLSPVNFILTYSSKGRQTAVLETKTVPGLDVIKENYHIIRDEAQALLDAGVFQRPPSVDEPGFNTFEKGGWRKYTLKWFANECRDAAVEMCPRTCSLLDKVPAIQSAMFTVLPPDGKVGRHHDPIASSLRYHVGLVTPNSDQCALVLDGKRYPLHDGEELLFDQTFLHSAVNQTDQIRVILSCDVEKTQLRGVARRLANGINYFVVAKFTGADEKGKISWVSRIYQPIYRFRHFVKDFVKPKSILAYNVIKFVSIALLLYLVSMIL